MEAQQKDLKVSYKKLIDLKPYANNARTHSKEQVKQIADSIKTFGFTNPVLIDKSYNIVAGHGRLEGAKLLGMDSVPTILLEHLTEAQKKAYIIADNRLAEKAGWDKEILAIELQGLLEIDLDFDLSITGFEMPEIDLMIQDLSCVEDEEEYIPEINESIPPITKLGDVWQLGDQRIYCGDSLKKESYEAVMQGNKANLIFTDPPYNVKIDGHVCGKGKTKHREFAMASGEMTAKQFTTFLQTSFEQIVKFSTDGSIHFVCMDWRHMQEILQAGNNAYTELKNLCVWNKNNGGMGSLYRSKHELVFVFKNGKASHINNVELGQYGRYRTNVWDYAGVNTLKNGREDELNMHPTVKPIDMVADAIMDCSNRNDLVLDPFGGSGTTLIAAERVGRRAALIELDPRYVDVTIKRWQRATGKQAIHAETGKPFMANIPTDKLGGECHV
jgi:DNA modification methylase